MERERTSEEEQTQGNGNEESRTSLLFGCLTKCPCGCHPRSDTWLDSFCTWLSGALLASGLFLAGGSLVALIKVKHDREIQVLCSSLLAAGCCLMVFSALPHGIMRCLLRRRQILRRRANEARRQHEEQTNGGQNNPGFVSDDPPSYQSVINAEGPPPAYYEDWVEKIAPPSISGSTVPDVTKCATAGQSSESTVPG